MFVMFECKIDNKCPQRHTFILYMLYSISSAAPNTFLYFISFKVPYFLEIPTIFWEIWMILSPLDKGKIHILHALFFLQLMSEIQMYFFH